MFLGQGELDLWPAVAQWTQVGQSDHDTVVEGNLFEERQRRYRRYEVTM